MRRQNRACDQCRKAKRACDAPSLRGDHIRSSGNSSQGLGPGDPEARIYSADTALGTKFPDSESLPCSYCLKTNKRCTLNWVRSQLKANEAAPSRSNNSSRIKRRRTGNEAELSRILSHSEQSTSDTSGIDGDAMLYLQHIPSPESPELSLWNSAMGLEGSTLNDSSSFPADLEGILRDSERPVSEFDSSTVCADTGLLNFTFNDQLDNLDFLNKSPFDTSDSARTGTMPTSIPTSEIHVTGHNPQEELTDGNLSMMNKRRDGMSQSILDDVNAPSKSNPKDHVPASRRRPSASSAPSSIEYAMFTRMNNDSISQNLLQIYHDVLEHNLSCWLQGETCPYRGDYRLKKGPANMYRPLASPPETLRGRPGQEHQGEEWSNRIYHRVIKLDRTAQSIGLIRLTRTQNQRAQRALHLVIMAFATQWAHNSARQRETYTINLSNMAFDTLPEEFDRHIQRSLWEQARSALEDCADIESYRVVCAELIFGLTQKPWEDSDLSSLEDNEMTPSGIDKATSQTHASILSNVSNIMAKEGPPIFMERAARKMHALKFKFDSHEAGLLRAEDWYRHRPVSAGVFSDPISHQDKETVDLLYWLAVMFDTISSSMNERPVVVADEDSQHEAAEESHPEDEAQSSTLQPKSYNNQRWRIDLFIQDDPERSSRSQLRWPCSYDEAANMVTRSAPVKVLLYRYVHYLQNMVRKPNKTKGRPMEESIRDALLVYRYWNVTYGPFFRDLVEQYSSVPARIRGWFVCIVAHWHLASLMLADLIELVDDNGLGLPTSLETRLNAHTVARIRKSSADQLSDLARIATPNGLNHSEREPQMPDFHFAVREGTILTEPWTMILIRAFTKAAILHLHEATNIELQGQLDILGHERETFRRCLRRCEECIRALWLLGKKSDMARNVALVLLKGLNLSGGREPLPNATWTGSTFCTL